MCATSVIREDIIRTFKQAYMLHFGAQCLFGTVSEGLRVDAE